MIMPETEKLLSKCHSGESNDDSILILLEMLIMERKAYLRLRENLATATNELDDACANHEISVCHKKQDAVIRLIINN